MELFDRKSHVFPPQCYNKNQPSVLSINTRELSVKRKDLRASTLVGLTLEHPILTP